MKPPPPIPQEDGLTTQTAKAVATAASTAFPPSSRMAAPACEASRWSDATMPLRAHSAFAAAVHRTSSAAEDRAPVKGRSAGFARNPTFRSELFTSESLGAGGLGL